MTAPAPVVSPWMPVAEACAYAKRSRKTVMRALQRCVATGGREGLRGYQQGVNCRWSIHREDLDRWVRGESPSRGVRRLGVAS